MLNLNQTPKAFFISAPLLALLFTSNVANAEIYKWRDNRGVTQYSDRPPASDFVKASRTEIVNALQSKDICVVGPIKKNLATTASNARNLEGFFNFFGTATAATGKTGINPITSSVNRSATVTAALPAASRVSNPAFVSRPAVASTPVRVASTAYSPLKPTSAFTTGNKSVTVFGFPVGIKTATKSFFGAPAAATPVAIAPVAVATPTPVAPAPAASAPLPAAPAPTVAAPVVTTPAVTKPTQVAIVTPPAPTSTPTANIVQSMLQPAVDISKNIIPVAGYSTFRTQSTTEIAPPSGGDFRVGCAVSHMSNDDPMVYPNQQGAAHHHTFFGNTSVNYKSNLDTLASTGNSTCGGGIMNRSAYWIPSMINTETNSPVIPTGNVLVYYKHGDIDGSLIKAPPKGLRMIAGNSKAKTSAESSWSGFKCHPGINSKRAHWPQTASITPSSGCEVGDDLTFFVSFPQCWDGKNLDSPNHKDHMAYPSAGSCPATHPIPIPAIGVNVHYIITAADKIDKWRLASDNYSASLPGGYSGHADWVNGWDEATMAGIIKNCINGKKDAHAHLLCDGRSFY